MKSLNKARLAALGFFSVLLLAGCVGGDAAHKPREAVFVGIDISGSYRKAGYDDSLEFLSYYIYGRLHGLGNLHPAKALFVGEIGGKVEDETKSFHPIQDFEGKSVEQIHADLKSWFSGRDVLSDFNSFFKQSARIAEKRNLVLAPITIVMLSDGIPALPGEGGENAIGHYDQIDLSPLEYLSRNVTVRLLYANPQTSTKWETGIKRSRVRLWTLEQQVAVGWRAQLQPGAPPEQQDKLWKWVEANVDYRVRPVRIKLKPRSA
jgi:hypothetical protein